jgi:hypothetical protein
VSHKRHKRDKSDKSDKSDKPRIGSWLASIASRRGLKALYRRAGCGDLGACFRHAPLLLKVGAYSLNSDLIIQRVPPRHDLPRRAIQATMLFIIWFAADIDASEGSFG